MKFAAAVFRHALRFLAGAASALLLAALGGRWWWALDVLTNYWPQLTALNFAGGGLLWLLRERSFARLPLACALLGSWWLWPFYWPAPPLQSAVEPAAAPVSLLLVNIYSFRPDVGDLLALIAETDPDIVVLLETVPGHYSQIESLRTTYPHAFHEPRLTGTAVFSRLPLEMIDLLQWPGGRIDVAAMLSVDERPFILLATHGRAAVSRRKARERDLHLFAMGEFISAQSLPVLLAGDLNATPFSRRAIDFRRAAGLVESRRGRGIMGTWPTASFLGLPGVFDFLQTPLDHILATPGIRLHVFRKAPRIDSDHDPLWVEFSPES